MNFFLISCGNNEVENKVKSLLKDPDSAQFRKVKNTCGEVNAKNSFGGYTGYKRFLIYEGQVLIEETDNNVYFNKLNYAICEDGKVNENKIKKCLELSDYYELVSESKKLGNSKQSLIEIHNQFKGDSLSNDRLKIINDVYAKNLISNNQFFIECYKENL